MTSVAERLSASLSDRYIIERELGAGGMATVYLARDLKHDRPVALKVLRPELAAALGGARFLLEVKITARLNHPHILPLLDSGEVDDVLYYAMPFVAGETLRDRLARDKQLPIEDALRIAREVADALDYAHSHGVIHRDIKPENILLQSGYAVVADFGIARAITAAAVERQTATGVAVGTPTYMSPEQATASRDIDGRADQYSLGCVLYEMLAGQAPFTGPTVESIVRQHVMTPPPSVTNIRPAVPANVAAALTRALAKTPADRFNTARQFAEALTGTELAPATESVAPRRRRNYLIGAAVVVALATVFLLSRLGRPGTPASATLPRTSIAVLPFENLTGAGPQAYFAGGLQDELLTQLSTLAALRVISRASMMGYAGKHTPLRQLATELHVGSVVEATVQTDAARLRVNVRLIDAATGTDLWAQRYDRTLDDAFAIQSDIAQQIAAAVGAALTSSQRQGLAAAPTANDTAYRLYLQGQDYMGGDGKQNWEIAEKLYERALALDPRFALAHVGLSEVNGWMYLFRYDLSPARLVRQREEAQAALRLAPDLPQGHYAMGLVYYVGPLDYHRALDEFRLAQAGLPSSAGYSTWIGFTARRLGNWNEALAAYERLKQLEPRAAGTFSNIGGQTYGEMHRYAEEIQADNLALSLAPDLYAAALFKGWSYARWHGQLDTLRAVVRTVPMDASLGALGSGAAQYVQLLLWERRGDSLLHALPALRVGVFESPRFFLPSSLFAGWAHQLRGDGAAAHVAFDSARALLDSVTRERPDDWRVHAARGLALAGLGRRADARREAAWLQQSSVYRDDAFDGPLVGEDRARILAGAGDVDGALEEIERLLSRPSWISANMLRLDPRWDPIREQPRFKALLAKYAVR
jgi:TolB-like protein